VASPQLNDRCRAGCRRLVSTPPNDCYRQQRRTATDPFQPAKDCSLNFRSAFNSGHPMLSSLVAVSAMPYLLTALRTRLAIYDGTLI